MVAVQSQTLAFFHNHFLLHMPHLNPLYVKVEHVTKINARVCDCTATIAHAMTTLPLRYPQSVGYSMQHVAQVASGVDTDLSLGDFLSKHPLTIIYNIPEPLSATPPNDPSLHIMITNLQAEVVALRKGLEDLRRSLKVEVAARKVEGAVQKVEVEDLRARFDLFTGSWRSRCTRCEGWEYRRQCPNIIDLLLRSFHPSRSSSLPDSSPPHKPPAHS